MNAETKTEPTSFKLFEAPTPTAELYKPRKVERAWQLKPKIVGLMTHKTPSVLPELKRLFRNYSTRNLTRAYHHTQKRAKYTETLKEIPHWADLVGLENSEKRTVRNARRRQRQGRLAANTQLDTQSPEGTEDEVS